MGISLIEDEKIIKKTHPHILAMSYLYVIWACLIALGIGATTFREEIQQWIFDFPKGEYFYNTIFFSIWSIAILIPAIAVSFFRINWWWLALGLVLCVSGPVLHYYQEPVFAHLEALTDMSFVSKLKSMVLKQWPDIGEFILTEEIHNYLLIVIGTIGLLCSNSFRRSHSYYLTNRRLIARFGYFTTQERDVLYSKVDDLILQQGFIGTLLGFGTLIPLSASGIGTGSDQVFAAASGGGKVPGGPTLNVTVGGGKSVTVPRAPSFYSLYGIPSVKKVRNLILEQMERREYIR